MAPIKALLLGFVVVSSAASATRAQPLANPAAKADARDRLRRDLLDQMRTMRMWKLTEELKLDEGTAAKLFPALAKFDDRMRELGHERGELFRSLHEEMTAPNPNAVKIAGILDKLYHNRAKRIAADEERWMSVRKILTPVQQAKMVLLMPRLEESLRRKIRETLGKADRGDKADGQDKVDPKLDGPSGERPHLERPLRAPRSSFGL